MRRLAPVALLFLLVLFVPCAGAWTWPVSGPLLQTFSFDQAHPYAAGQHRGIAIGADPGAPVLAPAGGVVSFAGTVASNGKTVTIETPAGLAVSLTHLGSLGVKQDDAVAEGDTIGTVGPSGTGEFDVPYVHLGIRDAGNPQGYLDPLSFLPVAVVPPAEPVPAPPPAAAPAAPPVEPAPPAPSPVEAPARTAPVAEAPAPAPAAPVVEAPAPVSAAPSGQAPTGAPAVEPPGLPLVPPAAAAPAAPAADAPTVPAPFVLAAKPERWTVGPAAAPASIGHAALARPISLPPAAFAPYLAVVPPGGALRGVAPSSQPIARTPVSLAAVPRLALPAGRGVTGSTAPASTQVGGSIRPVFVPALVVAAAALAAAVALLRRRGRRPGPPLLRLRPLTRFGRQRVAA